MIRSQAPVHGVYCHMNRHEPPFYWYIILHHFAMIPQLELDISDPLQTRVLPSFRVDFGEMSVHATTCLQLR